MLVQLIKLVDVDFMQSMRRTKLVDLVVNLVIDPGLIIVDRVVLDCLPGHIGLQPVHNLDFLEVNDHTALCAARNIAHRISLHRHLHDVEKGDQRNLCVPAGLNDAFEQGTASKVDADVAFGNLMKTLADEDAN